jgi:hypothetical protein
MENQVSAELVILNVPEEISELALTVSEVKRNEVVGVISDIFKGTENWAEQISKIKVQSENDILNIELASTARKNIKKARLEAEKVFDAKRSEVQAKMIDYKAEDQLWLKSKQIMQIKFKHLEDLMEHEETFLIRIAQEKRAARTAERMLAVSKYTNTMTEEQIRDLDDIVFETILNGLIAKKQANDAKAQAEAIEMEEKTKRAKEREALFSEFIPYFKPGASIDYSDDSFDFESALQVLKKRKADKEAEEKAKEEENKRLKAETEKAKEEAEKVRKEAEEALALERKKVETEAEKNAKLQAELEFNKAVEKRNKELQERAEKEALEAKEKAEKAPIIEKLNAWIEKMDLELPPVNNEITADIVNKFIGFKKWAKEQVNKQ